MLYKILMVRIDIATAFLLIVMVTINYLYTNSRKCLSHIPQIQMLYSPTNGASIFLHKFGFLLLLIQASKQFYNTKVR